MKAAHTRKQIYKLHRATKAKEQTGRVAVRQRTLKLFKVPVPSFSTFRSSSHDASIAKQRTPRYGTTAELLLRSAVWGLGGRYRVYVADLPGRPDLVFRRARVVVFCDGDFWHGRNWARRQTLLKKGANAEYWINKISYNRKRDRRQSRELLSAGWSVLRFWETDVLADPSTAATKIMLEVRQRTP